MIHDPHPWAADLSLLYSEIWTLLVRGVADRHAASRHPTFATTSAGGLPEMRTLVLRGADPLAASLDFHTDIRSAKVTSLRGNPNAALHIWDQSAHLQIRLAATLEILTGQSVTAIFAKVPEASRLNYNTQLAPGTPIADALAYKTPPTQPIEATHFAVLRCNVMNIDALHLGPSHRRARFKRSNNWAGQWLVP